MAYESLFPNGVVGELLDYTESKLCDSKLRKEVDRISDFYRDFADREFEGDIHSDIKKDEEEDIGVVPVRGEEIRYDLEADTRYELFSKVTLRMLPELAAAPYPYTVGIIAVLSEKYASDHLECEDTLESWCEKHKKIRDRDSRIDRIYKLSKGREDMLRELFTSLKDEEIAVDSLEEEKSIADIIENVVCGCPVEEDAYEKGGNKPKTVQVTP